MWEFVGLKDVNDLQKRTMTGKKVKKAPRKRMSPTAKSVLFFGVTAAFLIAMLLWPSPDGNRKSGIELVGEERDVVVYGPELPQNTVGGFPETPVDDSGVLPERTASADAVTYVYASDGQDCYHKSTCKFAYASGHRFTVYEAQLLGYKPCGRCNPPTE